MKKKINVILIVCCSILLLSFFASPALTPHEKLKSYYNSHFVDLSQQLVVLKKSVEQDASEKKIQQNFLAARLSYKGLELFLEYYFELDVAKFNGLAINFIEEEDPTAYQEPQGFQMIETFIYPTYNKEKKKELLRYIDQLLTITNGLSNNNILFNPENFALDAVMEELYRVLALGITGFDSPIAQLSVQEAGASLTSVQFVMETYRESLTAAGVKDYDTIMLLLTGAKNYLRKHNNFNAFDRAAFITNFLNPLCTRIGAAKTMSGFSDNPMRYSLIRKTGQLFKASSLNRDRYLYDDTINDVRIQLGKKIFYDPLLSANGKRACAGCHQPGKSFTDGLPKALQADEHGTLPRNTPSLWNAALQMNLFYDSRQKRLDDVVMEVLSNDKEMNMGADKAAEKLNANAAYVSLFKVAYPTHDSIVTERKIGNAIAMYIRSLISYNSRFDKYMRGEKTAMRAGEIKGFNLFMGKAKCATCHYVPLFNGSKPPTYYYQESEVLGVPATTDTAHAVLDADPGRGPVLNLDFMNHAFKTPTLRNIALSAPYMHNGIYKTLEEVIDFYDRGGGLGLGIPIPNQTLPGDKLQLTQKEKIQLKAFLLALTDTSGAPQLVPINKKSATAQ
ncbi:MAG: cytochrome c peroxidase [Chitinophagaceae bacterium]